jgi:hypothetical protein
MIPSPHISADALLEQGCNPAAEFVCLSRHAYRVLGNHARQNPQTTGAPGKLNNLQDQFVVSSLHVRLRSLEPN